MNWRSVSYVSGVCAGCGIGDRSGVTGRARLFTELGFAGIVCTLIALAMLPLMRRLSAQHAEAAVPVST